MRVDIRLYDDGEVVYVMFGDRTVAPFARIRNILVAKTPS